MEIFCKNFSTDSFPSGRVVQRSRDAESTTHRSAGGGRIAYQRIIVYKTENSNSFNEISVRIYKTLRVSVESFSHRIADALCRDCEHMAALSGITGRRYPKLKCHAWPLYQGRNAPADLCFVFLSHFLLTTPTRFAVRACLRSGRFNRYDSDDRPSDRCSRRTRREKPD